MLSLQHSLGYLQHTLFIVSSCWGQLTRKSLRQAGLLAFASHCWDNPRNLTVVNMLVLCNGALKLLLLCYPKTFFSKKEMKLGQFEIVRASQSHRLYFNKYLFIDKSTAQGGTWPKSTIRLSHHMRLVPRSTALARWFYHPFSLADFVTQMWKRSFCV